MRTIKFRVWDIERKKYLSDVSFADSRIPSNWQQFYIPQQFTGLLDKSGVEIYEGDIINGEYADGDAFAPIAVEDMCWLHKMTVLGDAWRRLEANTVEVIGNIHENPDLLETK